MESVLVQKTVDGGGALFRSFSSSFSLDNSYTTLHYTTLPSTTQPPLLPLPSITNPAWKGRVMPRQHHHQKNPRHASTSPKKREQRDRCLPIPILAAIPASVQFPVMSFAVPEIQSTKVSREEEGIGEEVVWTGTVYSVSPPPSSVPMPSFVVRQKGGTQKNTEKKGGTGFDACATNELRRLLKL